MIPLKQAMMSSIGKKYVMGATGLGLVGFLVTHLLGNLQLYYSADAFNKYGKSLADLGPALYALEVGLAGMFLVHAFLAIKITMDTKKARKDRYQHAQQTKGGPSYSTPASRNMIITGGVLLLFLVIHVLHMKFGVFDGGAKYDTTIDGAQAVDLYSRVKTSFKNPAWSLSYVAVMLFLGAHMRHGFWSAVQSLGALNHRLEKPANALGVLVAGLISIGFLGIPVFFLLFG